MRIEVDLECTLNSDFERDVDFALLSEVDVVEVFVFVSILLFASVLHEFDALKKVSRELKVRLVVIAFQLSARS
jgi:hypothetical protein